MSGNHMVLLDGGNLQAKYVIVMAAMRDEQSWASSIDACLRKIQAKPDIRAASFLALGTGEYTTLFHTSYQLMHNFTPLL